MNKFIEYLRSCRENFENEMCADSKILNYLYFTDACGRFSIYPFENEKHRLILSQTQKNIEDLESFRPNFEEMLEKEGITSLFDYKIPDTLAKVRASEKMRETFINTLENIQKKHGILHALLILREWAFFPDNKKGSINRSRTAKYYLGNILNFLREPFSKNDDLTALLDFCGKRTLKVLPWELKKKDLRSPPPPALPIYKDEAASYVEYFLNLATGLSCDLQDQYAQMTIYLSFSLACFRLYSNFFSPQEILKITCKDIYNPTPRKKINSIYRKDIIEKSKATKKGIRHLLLQLPSDYLLGLSKTPESPNPSHCLDGSYKAIKIRDKEIIISSQLATALELMGQFSINCKTVANRLNEAYDCIGLKQSSGRISPRCFLFSPHHWPDVDARSKSRKL